MVSADAAPWMTSPCSTHNRWRTWRRWNNPAVCAVSRISALTIQWDATAPQPCPSPETFVQSLRTRLDASALRRTKGVADYAAFLQSEAGHCVVVAMVGAIDDGTGEMTPGLCEDTPCEAACQSTNPRGPPCFSGAQSPNTRLFELVSRLEGSVFESMCDGGVSRAMAQVGELIVPLARENL